MHVFAEANVVSMKKVARNKILLLHIENTNNPFLVFLKYNFKKEIPDQVGEDKQQKTPRNNPRSFLNFLLLENDP